MQTIIDQIKFWWYILREKLWMGRRKADAEV